jgi:hypothetical protein
MLETLKQTIRDGLNLGAHPLDEDERRTVDLVLEPGEPIVAFARGCDGRDAMLLVATPRQLIVVERELIHGEIHAIPRSDLLRVRRLPGRWGTTLEILTARGKTYYAAAVDDAQGAEFESLITAPSNRSESRATLVRVRAGRADATSRKLPADR